MRHGSGGQVQCVQPVTPDGVVGALGTDTRRGSPAAPAARIAMLNLDSAAGQTLFY